MSDVSLALDTTAAIAWIRGEPAIIDTLVPQLNYRQF
jgi:hypothetical protein